MVQVLKAAQHFTVLLLPLILIFSLTINVSYANFARNYMTGKAISRNNVQENSSQIKHIVVIMQENRAFDIYFGVFPRVQYPFNLSLHTCLPYGNISCYLRPWNADGASNKNNTVESQDLSHGAPNARIAYDNGKMNSFANAQTESYRNDTLAYYTGFTLPDYWDYASHWALDANFFSSFRGPSYPNHLYTFAARTEGGNNELNYNLSFTHLRWR